MKRLKLEAAQRQLDAAINLYFDSGNEVAVHALASAAFRLVTELDEHAGNVDEMQRFIRPEREGDFRHLWNEPQNFFKNADRDPEAILDFKPQITEAVLMMACEEFKELGDWSQAMYLFAARFGLQNPDLPSDGGAEFVREISPRWNSSSRDSFRSTFLSSLREIGAPSSGPL